MKGAVKAWWYTPLILAVLVFASSCAPTTPDIVAPSNSSEAVTCDDEYVAPVSTSEGQELHSLADVVERIKPTVTAITTEILVRDILGRTRTQETAGSGWIIREDGYVVTNSHVVEAAETVFVLLDDGREFEATAVYADSWTDIAAVKIDVTGLPVAPVGDSGNLRIGDPLVAIGNPLGLGISATAGIVSALSVSLSTTGSQALLDLVQTDAAINPGNSGGPLVNGSGEVIGINSLKIALEAVEGMGYAINIQQAIPVIEKLIEHGRVERAWLGVSVYPVSPALAERHDLAVDTGILIDQVVPNSPAEAAGLEVGDVIVQFGDKVIIDTHCFIRAIYAKDIGDEVEIVFWRGDETMVTTARLEGTPDA